MGDPQGFLKHTERVLPDRRRVPERLQDWNEVHTAFSPDLLREQASRCMDCGIPFCNNGCPLGNLIPDWNHFVYKKQWQQASDRLHATNNFPEFTGRLCPAPCEGACVLGISQTPVTIKNVEVEIAERAWKEGWTKPVLPSVHTGKRVAVVGSGPAGLAAAQQLTRAGHSVTVFERANRIGGLLRYGIPEFKMQKKVLDRRIEQMEKEGTVFRVNANVGENIQVAELRENSDAIVLAGGSTIGRDLPIEGRELSGIHLAMEYLPLANRVQEGDFDTSPLLATGKHVVIIGGGDTGADCLGTAHRQGALSTTQLEIMPKPPLTRDQEKNPWPLWPQIFRTASAHEEGGDRLFSVETTRFEGKAGKVTGITLAEVDVSFTDGRPSFNRKEGTEFTLPADLILLALGFTGPQKTGLLEDFEIELTARGTVAKNANWMTNRDGIFVCGDMTRGQSLIVWAISEGRSAAAAVDRYLMGETFLPSVLFPM